jgi:hypothetical protein
LNSAISSAIAVRGSTGQHLSAPAFIASRIKIDILAGSFEELERPSDSRMTAAELVDIGSQGIEIDLGRSQYYLLPSELIYRRVAESAESETAEELLDRAMSYLGFDADRWRSRDVRLRAFRTASFVEDESHTRALEVVRGFVVESAPDRSALLAAARSAGDYLVRMQRTDGSFYYWYRPLVDEVDVTHYNIVRHAGTCISLFDLYGVTRDSRYLTAARRGMTFIRSRFKQLDRKQPAESRKDKDQKDEPQPGSSPLVSPDRLKAELRTAATPAEAQVQVQVQNGRHHTEGLYVIDNDHKAKLGAGGLALLALTREIELDHNAERSEANALASGILAMQRADGSFETDIEQNGDELDSPPSLYYPGEAMLGLIRLYRLNRDFRLLDAIRRGADYLVTSQRRQRDLPPDAWLVQALESIYEVTKDARYAEHAIDLAAPMAASLYAADGPEGYAGAVARGIPRVTPTASRSEGILAAYRVARATGDPRAERLLAAARVAAQFQLTQQFSTDNGFFLPNPARAVGGFHESLDSTRIRIDYVQHNISSLLGLAQIDRLEGLKVAR